MYSTIHIKIPLGYRLIGATGFHRLDGLSVVMAFYFRFFCHIYMTIGLDTAESRDDGFASLKPLAMEKPVGKANS